MFHDECADRRANPSLPAASERKYFTLDVDFDRSLAPFVTWVNKTEQMKGFYPESSKPFGGLKFSEPPQIKFELKGRRGTLKMRILDFSNG